MLRPANGVGVIYAIYNVAQGHSSNNPLLDCGRRVNLPADVFFTLLPLVSQPPAVETLRSRGVELEICFHSYFAARNAALEVRLFGITK